MPTLYRPGEELGVRWKPYCETCIAELAVKDNQAVCPLCNRTWLPADIGCLIENREEAERPDPVAAQALLDTINGSAEDGPIVRSTSATAWVTTEKAQQEAESQYQVWLDGYTSEPNADPDTNIQAVMMFLAELLTDEAITQERHGIQDTYERSRDVFHRIYTARYRAKKRV